MPEDTKTSRAAIDFMTSVAQLLREREKEIGSVIQSVSLSADITSERVSFSLDLRQGITSSPALTFSSDASPIMGNLVLLPQASGTGYYSYSPTENQYGTRSTIDALVRIAIGWRDGPSNGGAEFGIGDISLHEGGPFPPHAGHQNGTESDIRPMRIDRQHIAVDWHDVAYDRELTQRLVDAIRADSNCRKILFNDPDIQGVEPYPKHDNHLHVKFVS
jgi:murein endopeptidase